MASIRVEVDGLQKVRTVLLGINPERQPAWVRRALTKGGLLVQREAAQNQIRRGGSGPPLAHRLTSRTGTGRRSIRVDRGGLPRFFVDIGSDLAYMRVHEGGGTVQRKAHTRRSRLGNLHSVRAHQATYPARPYLQPALEVVDAQLEGVFSDEWGREIDRL